MTLQRPVIRGVVSLEPHCGHILVIFNFLTTLSSLNVFKYSLCFTSQFYSACLILLSSLLTRWLTELFWGYVGLVGPSKHGWNHSEAALITAQNGMFFLFHYVFFILSIQCLVVASWRLVVPCGTDFVEKTMICHICCVERLSLCGAASNFFSKKTPIFRFGPDWFVLFLVDHLCHHIPATHHPAHRHPPCLFFFFLLIYCRRGTGPIIDFTIMYATFML